MPHYDEEWGHETWFVMRITVDAAEWQEDVKILYYDSWWRQDVMLAT